MAIKLGRMMIYLEVLLPIKSPDLLVKWSCKITRQTKISTTTMPMANKLGRMVVYHKGFSTIETHDPSITWSCGIM